MINVLSNRREGYNIEDFLKYTVICPCCRTALNFSKDDVYIDEECCMHHEYIDCPECNEKIQLPDDEFFR